MSEDFGPETIGPYTLNQIITDYARDLRNQGQGLSPGVLQQDITLLNQVCERVEQQEKAGVKVADTIEIMEALGKSSDHSFRGLAILGGLVGAFAALGLILLFWRGRTAAQVERVDNIVPFLGGGSGLGGRQRWRSGKGFARYRVTGVPFVSEHPEPGPKPWPA